MYGKSVSSLRQSELSEWPRRLLYLPEMRSYQREAGNVYRDETEPSYHILSYTWGRWQLPPGQDEALDVSGISWRMPTVDPRIFTASEFHTVLQQVGDSVNWIWLDVACIDQENPEVCDDEIGRQAGIFGKAKEAFIWLHHTPTVQLQQFADQLFDLADRVDGDEEYFVNFGEGNVSTRWTKDTSALPTYIADEHWVEHFLKSLDILDSDPWFSSLWTLQEAYLRGDAKIISKEGHLLERIGYERAGLGSLLIAWGRIDEAIRRSLADKRINIPSCILQKLECIQRKMNRLGLRAGDNPVVLYSSAGYRKTTREEDRIYGIMQIFGFRLGKSAAPGSFFSLPELEIQFAEALNAKSPVWAQLFIHGSEQAAGRHWCINQSSHLPDCLTLSVVTPQDQCTITLLPDGEPVFRGKACLFQDIGNAWTQARLQPLQPNFWGSETADGQIPVETLALDNCQFTRDYIPEDLSHNPDELSTTNQHLRDFMMREWGQRLKILLLGKLRSITDDIEDEDQLDYDEQNQYDAWIGMIVRPVARGDRMTWQRIGLAIWAYYPKCDSTSISWQRTEALLD